MRAHRSARGEGPPGFPGCAGLHAPAPRQGLSTRTKSVLTGVGIDPAVWSARAVNDALNADMRARGTTWPDHIANPGAFLASRLRRLSWTPPETTPTKAGGCAAASIDQTPRPVVLTDAARARITAAREEIRRVLTERAQRSREDHTSSTLTALSRRNIGVSVQTRHGGAMN